VSYAVAAPHSAATHIADSTFRAGGNAIDAAIAASAALAVVYPHMCSLGGDLIGLLAAPDGSLRVINGSGAAPRAIASAASGWSRMPLDGPHSVTVPGAVAAWQTMHQLGAAMPWDALIDPAARLAVGGIPVARSLAVAIAGDAARIAADPGMRDVFLPRGGPLPEGAALRQPALARSLGAIAGGGAAALYAGEVGRNIVACLRSLGSTISREDLSRHRTDVCEPIGLRTGELEVFTAPPNSQGLVLLQTLAALEELRPGDYLGADAGLLGELFRLGAAERDRHLGDPRFTRVPVEHLLSRERAVALAAAARESRGVGAAVAEGSPPTSSGDTIALVTADRAGYAVVVIQSVFGLFGAGIMDPASGIVCHNRGSFFSLNPGSPNVLEGGTRPWAVLLSPRSTPRSSCVSGAAWTPARRSRLRGGSWPDTRRTGEVATSMRKRTSIRRQPAHFARPAFECTRCPPPPRWWATPRRYADSPTARSSRPPTPAQTAPRSRADSYGMRMPLPCRRPSSRSSIASLTASSGYEAVCSVTFPWAARVMSSARSL
jgi:gamma-glutamyltranspeptidase/glutathione hydrolase